MYIHTHTTFDNNMTLTFDLSVNVTAMHCVQLKNSVDHDSV